jgi:hypothetical protein
MASFRKIVRAAQQNLGAVLVIVPVNVIENPNTNTYREHEFERPLGRWLYAVGLML